MKRKLKSRNKRLITGFFKVLNQLKWDGYVQMFQYRHIEMRLSKQLQKVQYNKVLLDRTMLLSFGVIMVTYKPYVAVKRCRFNHEQYEYTESMLGNLNSSISKHTTYEKMKHRNDLLVTV